MQEESPRIQFASLLFFTREKPFLNLSFWLANLRQKPEIFQPGDHEKKVHMRQHFFRQLHELKPLDGHWQSLLGEDLLLSLVGMETCGDGETPRKTTFSQPPILSASVLHFSQNLVLPNPSDCVCVTGTKSHLCSGSYHICHIFSFGYLDQGSIQAQSSKRPFRDASGVNWTVPLDRLCFSKSPQDWRKMLSGCFSHQLFSQGKGYINMYYKYIYICRLYIYIMYLLGNSVTHWRCIY